VTPERLAQEVYWGTRRLGGGWLVSGRSVVFRPGAVLRADERLRALVSRLAKDCEAVEALRELVLAEAERPHRGGRVAGIPYAMDERRGHAIVLRVRDDVHGDTGAARPSG